MVYASPPAASDARVLLSPTEAATRAVHKHRSSHLNGARKGGVLDLRLRPPVHTDAYARDRVKRLVLSASPEAWAAADPVWRREAVSLTLAKLDVVLTYEGDLRHLTPLECRDTFHSFYGATELRLSKGQRWSEATWRSFCNALAHFTRLRRLVFWPAPDGVDPQWMTCFAEGLVGCGGSLEELHLHVLKEYPKLFALVPQWLPRMPRLLRLHTPGMALSREDLDAFKLGFRGLLESHFGVRLREFMAGHHFPELCGTGLTLEGDILAVRQADLDFAASRVWADPNDGGAWAASTEYFQKRDRQAGILAALRHREYAHQRYFVLFCFLYRAAAFREEKEDPADMPVKTAKKWDGRTDKSVVGAVVSLPPELRCFVLEYWLGGRIHVGQFRKSRVMLRPKEASST